MIRTEHSDGELWAEIYYQRELRHSSRIARCRPLDRPFWAPARARATPPPNY
jgi:aminomethyltransferase